MAIDITFFVGISVTAPPPPLPLFSPVQAGGPPTPVLATDVGEVVETDEGQEIEIEP